MEIEGFENYLIFENGDVVNKKTGRKLKHLKDKEGYLKVCLCKNSKGYIRKIHRLLALYFIPNPDNKPQVDHINRIRDDNRLENLRWATNGENQINKGIMKNNKLGHRNILKDGVYYKIEIRRNGLTYRKRKKTLEEAIKQRDLMLSMWNEIR